MWFLYIYDDHHKIPDQWFVKTAARGVWLEHDFFFFISTTHSKSHCVQDHIHKYVPS